MRESEPFYTELRQAINHAIAPFYPGTTITVIELAAQGDFHWFYENLNGIFNRATFDWASARVGPGTVAGTARAESAGSFPNAYERVITSLAFRLSRADTRVLQEAQLGAQLEAHAMVSAYESIFGEITPPCLDEARVALGEDAITNKSDFVVAFILAFTWSGHRAANRPPLAWRTLQHASDLRALLPSMPEAGDDVLLPAKAYLDVFGDATKLQGALDQGGWIRRQLLENTRHPNAENGGMKTVDPKTGQVSAKEQVGYTIETPIATIREGLADPARVIRFTPSDEARAGLRWVGSRGSTQLGQITFVYQGFALVPILAHPWDPSQNTGWLDSHPIVEAQINQGRDVTGFVFVADPPFRLGPLEQGGNFGMLTSLLVTNPPWIELDARQLSSAARLALRPGSAGHLELAGGLPLPGLATRCGDVVAQHHGAALKLVSNDSDSDVGVNPLEETANVLGGVFDFPGTSESVRIG